jgi:signal transduction histidine kinase
LPDNLVNFILEDDFGQLWISHDRGIYRVPRLALDEVADGQASWVQCVSYTEPDGLPSEETNGQKSYPAGCKTRDGRLWFATTKGVVVFDPKLHHEELTPPRLVIEQVRATGRLIHDINPRDPFAEVSAVAIPRRGEEYHLPPGSGRVIEFTYTANTFIAAEKARFKYRLLGMDEKWLDVGTRRGALFTNLKPGRYHFQVTAANHHGVWSKTGATFAFRIAPFIYQTWWFYLTSGGAAIALVAGVVIWRLRELRKIHRLEQQAAITAERTRIAKDLHDGLGADLTRLTLLADLASGESAAGGTEHLKKLSNSSREAARELRELIWVANPANDNVEGLVSRVCQNAEGFLRDAGVKCRLEISPRLPEHPLSFDQRRNLLLVAREALNNVVKHAGATEVSLHASGENGKLALIIEDNGRGFDPNTARADGLGLNSMKKRIENLGGAFALESQSGRGTTITIELRLGSAK